MKAIFDISTVEYSGDKVRCPECRHLKPFLYATAGGTNRCPACLSGRPSVKAA